VILPALTLVLLLGALGCKEKGTQLTYGGTNGRSLRYKQTTNGKVITTMGGKTAEAKIDSEIIFSEKVSEVKPGTLEKRITYESGWIKTGENREELPLKDKIVILRMDATGELQEAKGLEGLFSGQGASLDLRRALEENQLVFPSRALNPGDNWTYEKKFDLSNIGALFLKGKAKMANLEGGGTGTAKIESSLDGKMSGEKKFASVTFVLEGDEEGRATTFFDVKKKVLVRHSSDISGSFEVKPTGAPTPQAEALQTKFYLKTTIVTAPKSQ
jgi:hypothetical protein